MALQQSGIQLVAKGFSQFISQIGRVNNAYGQMSRAQAKIARESTNNSRRVVESNNRVINSTTRLRSSQDRVFIATTRLSEARRRYTDIENVVNALQTINKQGTRQYAKALEDLQRASVNVTIAKKELSIAENNLEVSTNTVTMAVYRLALEQAKNIGISQQLEVIIAAVGFSFQALGVAIAAVGIAFRAFSAVVNTIISVIRKLYEGIKGILSLLNQITRPLRDFIGDVLRIASGVGLYDVFRQINIAMRNMIENLVESLSYFQRLNIQLEALTARDINAEFGIPMARAFQIASGPAEELLEWIRRIAVTTPFSVEGLSQTVAMANAMGLTIDQSKRLTLAVGNFTAAMGLTEDHMFRIIYNFGQMLAQGKLNGREFRDLANSFVPVWEMMRRMADQAGMTAQEFKELAFEGGVPVEAFFEEFIALASEGYPGAMEKMARTAQGVTNNIKDFIDTVIGIEFLGPTFDRFTSIAANALEKLLQPAVQKSAQMLGSLLVKGVDRVIAAFNRMWQAAGNVAEALGLAGTNIRDVFGRVIAWVTVFVSRMFDRMGTFLNNTAQRIGKSAGQYASAAAKWGYNIVAFFAKGMAMALKLVVRVITALGRILSHWLSPGSPPRILPDLPEWGMEAMREYLKGFTMVDFDILKGIQGPLKDALDVLEQTGGIGENQAGKIFANLSKEIARVLATGTGLDSLLEKIRSKTGPWGQDIAELAKRYFEWAEGVRALEAAEIALEKAQELEQKTRVDLSSQIREYNQLIRAGVDRSLLNARLDSINAAEEAARAATEERKAAEENVEAWEERVAQLEEAVKLQEELIQQLIDLTKEQIIEIEIDTGGVSAGIGDIGDMFGELPGIADDAMDEVERGVQREMEKFEEQWQDMWEQSMFAEAEKSVDAFIQGAMDAFDEFFGPLEEDIKELDTVMSEVFSKLFPSKAHHADTNQTNLSKFFDGLLEMITAIGDELGNIDWGKVGTAIGNMAGNLLSFIESGKAKDLAETIGNTVDGLANIVLGISAISDMFVGKRPWFDLIRAQLVGEGQTWDEWTDENVVNKILGSLSFIPEKALEIGLDFAGNMASTMTYAPDSQQKWGEFFTTNFVTPLLEAADDFFAGIVGEPTSIVPSAMSDINTTMNDEFPTILSTWDTNLGSILSKTISVFGIVAPGGIVLTVLGAMAAFATAIGTNAKVAADTFANSVVPIIKNALQGLIDRLQQAIDKANKLKNTLNSMPKTGGITKDTDDGGGGCFVAGTLVNTPAGPQKIETIQKGDVVWSYDENTGKVVPNKVLRTFVADKNLTVRVYTSEGELRCTALHRFLADGEWTEAIKLKDGNEVLTLDGKRAIVSRIKLEPYQEVLVYNFTVENTHTYFVENHCVHNVKAQEGGFLAANIPHIVGEAGWEVFMPNVSGWVTNQEQLLRIMRSGIAHAGVAGGTTSVTKVVNINMGGVVIENQMDVNTFQALVRETVREEFA